MAGRSGLKDERVGRWVSVGDYVRESLVVEVTRGHDVRFSSRTTRRGVYGVHP